MTEEADEITVELTISGTPAQGARIEVGGVDTLTLQDGRIVRMVSRFDAEEMKPLLELVQRGLS